MDEGSFAKYFDWAKPEQEQPNPIMEMQEVIGILADEESTAEELNYATQILKRYENTDLVDVELESCMVRWRQEEEANLIEFAKNIMMQIQLFLVEKGLNNFNKLSDTTSQFKFFKLRTFDEFRRTNFSVLIENPEKGGIDVYMKNFYDTFGNLILIIIPFKPLVF